MFFEIEKKKYSRVDPALKSCTLCQVLKNSRPCSDHSVAQDLFAIGIETKRWVCLPAGFHIAMQPCGEVKVL